MQVLLRETRWVPLVDRLHSGWALSDAVLPVQDTIIFCTGYFHFLALNLEKSITNTGSNCCPDPDSGHAQHRFKVKEYSDAESKFACTAFRCAFCRCPPAGWRVQGGACRTKTSTNERQIVVPPRT